MCVHPALAPPWGDIEARSIDDRTRCDYPPNQKYSFGAKAGDWTSLW